MLRSKHTKLRLHSLSFTHLTTHTKARKREQLSLDQPKKKKTLKKKLNCHLLTIKYKYTGHCYGFHFLLVFPLLILIHFLSLILYQAYNQLSHIQCLSQKLKKVLSSTNPTVSWNTKIFQSQPQRPTNC